MASRLDILNIRQGYYSSPKRKLSLLGKWFPTLSFYTLTIREVFRGSRLGKRGQLSQLDYYRNAVGVLRAVEYVGGQIEINGFGHVVNTKGPFVFVANHMSVLETFLFAAMIYPTGDHIFVVKKSLTEYPVFRHIMAALNPIVVGRENPREDLTAVLKQGTLRLKQNCSIIIFPQRTRLVTFEPEAFNTIGIKLARRADVPVIPVALKTDFWGQGKRLKDFGPIHPDIRVRFQFGEPIWIEGKGHDEHKQIVEFIREYYQGWEKSD